MSGYRVISNDAGRFKRFYSWVFCARTHLCHDTRIACLWPYVFQSRHPNSSAHFGFIDSVLPTKHLFGHDRPW